MTNALHARGPVPDGPRGTSTRPVLVGCSHGTDDADGRAAVRSILTGVAAARPELDVREAFVDVQEPEVADVVAHALDSDASGAVVVPLLLSVGFHVKVDIAAAVDQPGATAAVAARPGPAAASTSSWTAWRPRASPPTTPWCSPRPGRPTPRPRSRWSRSPPAWPTGSSSP